MAADERHISEEFKIICKKKNSNKLSRKSVIRNSLRLPSATKEESPIVEKDVTKYSLWIIVCPGVYYTQ